jgi:hypothetical protein
MEYYIMYHDRIITWDFYQQKLAIMESNSREYFYAWEEQFDERTFLENYQKSNKKRRQ